MGNDRLPLDYARGKDGYRIPQDLFPPKLGVFGEADPELCYCKYFQ